ncbi:MAG TPA: hypothetical protein VGC80_00705 [Acetobacteraceae bacterium]
MTQTNFPSSLQPQQIALILAGLRAFQKNGRADADIRTIAEDGGEFPALTDDQIDDLFEMLNSGSAIGSP